MKKKICSLRARTKFKKFNLVLNLRNNQKTKKIGSFLKQNKKKLEYHFHILALIMNVLIV